jgi:tetraacyldisaccharide 4'-kinase
MVEFGAEWSQTHRHRTSGSWHSLLGPLSALYRVAVELRLWAYKNGVLKKHGLPGFVISVGNVAVGGTGKTPAVAMLADWAQKEGCRVAILSKGYGGKHRKRVFEVSDGDRLLAGVQESGDEPYLLARKISGVPVVISKNRYLAGLYASRRYGTDVFILDDGFQHLKVKRNLDLALMDAANPIGNGQLLPRGPLREPLEQLKRAHAIILTRFRDKQTAQNAHTFLRERFPETPVFLADHFADQVVLPGLDQVHPPAFLRGKRVAAFAGIARPEAFHETLVDLGADPVYFKGFGDHHPYAREEINALIRRKEASNAQYLMTTEKDWMRIASLAPTCAEMGYLSISFDLLSEKDAFFGMIRREMSRQKEFDTRSS